MEISTIRHAQTDFNQQRRYAGTVDVPLSESGIRDCELARKALVGVPFDLVITSGLRRTLQTAQLLVGGGIPTIQSALCNERNYGRMQGLTEDEVELLEPRIHYLKVGGDFHSLNPPGGETFEMVRARAERFYAEVLQSQGAQRVLVVSHGVFLQQLHGVLRRQGWLDALGWGVPNLVLSSFHLNGSDVVRESLTHLLDRSQTTW